MKQRPFKNLFFALAITLFLLQACSKDKEKRNPSLLIYPDSKNIHYVVSGSIEQISYTSEINYPADQIINWIKRELNTIGWQPLKESFLNPGIPSSITKGWETFVDGTTNPSQKVHQWISDWSNSSGDILTYGLQYRYPKDGEQNLKTLFVFGNFSPKKVAEEALKITKSQR